MALRTTAARTVGCFNCRQWALRSFIASIGSQHPTSPAPLQRRALSITPQRRNEARERIQQDDHVLNDINDIGNTSSTQADPVPSQQEKSAPEEAPQPPQTPWYLQPHQQPTPSPSNSPLASRQRLPSLPSHAPPLLQPLLTHISLDLGLDDLSLLDLRTLDPPPALGSNLLMIIGTARSEKHLHVSADRLCRWLRSDPHNLTPFADGLLGRNELKLKMRRKAKRSRLMAGVGAKATGDTEIDEGIRTGWVCVNVGKVEGGDVPATEQERDGQREAGFVGFGVRQGGCRIVVQMMTEEKRGDVGLERLWTGILNRSRREKEGVGAGAGGQGGEGVEEVELGAVEGSEGVMRTEQEPSSVSLPSTAADESAGRLQSISSPEESEGVLQQREWPGTAS